MKEYFFLTLLGVLAVATVPHKGNENSSVATYQKEDSLTQDRKKHVDAVLKSIGGKRNAIAGSDVRRTGCRFDPPAEG